MKSISSAILVLVLGALGGTFAANLEKAHAQGGASQSVTSLTINGHKYTGDIVLRSSDPSLSFGAISKADGITYVDLRADTQMLTASAPVVSSLEVNGVAYTGKIRLLVSSSDQMLSVNASKNPDGNTDLRLTLWPPAIPGK